MLSCNSNHSKIIKNGLISNVVRRATMKSCCHKVDLTCESQLNRILDAGYNTSIVIEQLYKLIRTLTCTKEPN